MRCASRSMSTFFSCGAFFLGVLSSFFSDIAIRTEGRPAPPTPSVLFVGDAGFSCAASWAPALAPPPPSFFPMALLK